eukprot:s3938_g1.t2
MDSVKQKFAPIFEDQIISAERYDAMLGMIKEGRAREKAVMALMAEACFQHAFIKNDVEVIRAQLKKVDEGVDTWGVGTAVWSDRAWTYTRLGSFTTAAFHFKVRTAVDARKARFWLRAPAAEGMEVYVLGETKAVDAPWAFSAGAPELDDSWNEVFETLPEYEAGATYRFDFCRRRGLRPGEALSFDARQGGKVDIFLRAHGGFKRCELEAEAIVEEPASRPALRTAPLGRREGRCQDHRGLSPPPAEGWNVCETGWATHSATKTWRKRTADNGSELFFCVPESSCWATMPGKGLVPIDTCLSVLTWLRDEDWKGWKEHAAAVKALRQRLQVLAPSDSPDSMGEATETISERFPVRGAFRAPPPALRRQASAQRSQTPSKRVSFSLDDSLASETKTASLRTAMILTMEGGLTLVPAPGRDRDDGRRRRRREHDGDTRHSRRRSRSRSRRRRSPGRAPPPQDWRSGPPMEWP